MVDNHYGANLTTLKSNNRSLILRVLNTRGSVSRSELSRITGLTKTSITNIISSLIASGIVLESCTANSASGRKPTLLKLNGDAIYAAGVYISRDFAYANIMNLTGDIIAEHEESFDSIENTTTFLDKICHSVDSILSSCTIEKSRILGIGVAALGPVDSDRGLILDPPNFKGLHSIPVVEVLAEKFGLDTFMDKDMNACALAEKLFGDAKSIANFIFIGVTNGIGAGIVVNNRLFKGRSGFAGEIGHTTIQIDGERCTCGNTGCLELYASIPNIVKQVAASLNFGMESSLPRARGITWTDIVSEANKGDQLSRKAIDKLACYLSAGIVNSINFFDPEAVFIGQEAALAGNLLLIPLKEAINESFMFRRNKQVDIRLSKFINQSPRVGAASIVLNRFYDGEIFPE